MSSSVTRGLAQLIVAALVIFVIIGVLSVFFARAQSSAADAKKKTELSSIYTMLQFYYVGENESPVSPAEDGWCEINRFYGKDSCLEEVVRDGYVDAIIQSPDEDKYLYYNDESKFFVATRLHQELSERDRCQYSDDLHMWCKVFYKENE